MQDRYRHYRNVSEPGACVFITTTCLDFVHAFAEPSTRDLMALSILDDCRHYGVGLSAYVVMPHHVHLLGVLPEESDVRWFVNRFKSNSAKRLLPMLPRETLAGFDQQRGLNGRSFWQRSFRSLVIETEKAFLQKVKYIHENPVRAGLASAPEEYRWSSAPDWHAGFWDSDCGLDLRHAAARFAAARDMLRMTR